MICFHAELLRDRQTDLVEVLTGPDTAGTRVPVVSHASLHLTQIFLRPSEPN